MERVPVFENQDKSRDLRLVIKDWIGVPYHHMGETKGGVDCTKLMGLVLIELGILQILDNEYYGRDWPLHSDQEIVLMSFSKHMYKYLNAGYEADLLKWRQWMERELINGDVVCFTINSRGTCNHTAMWLDGKLVHAVEGQGVVVDDMSSYWIEKARYVFRLFQC